MVAGHSPGTERIGSAMFYGTGHCRERDDDPGRLVEFLNEQMRPAEVIAIEVDQFTSTNSLRTLVPRLVGQPKRAQPTRLSRSLSIAVPKMNGWKTSKSSAVRKHALEPSEP